MISISRLDALCGISPNPIERKQIHSIDRCRKEHEQQRTPARTGDGVHRIE